MREGSNPNKARNPHLQPPEAVTIAILNWIPVLSGYYQHALEVLKLSLLSLHAHTPPPFDVLVVDNGSDPSVVTVLRDYLKQGLIDHLILNKRNIGIANAQRLCLRAAPGDYVAYADGDIYFRENWLTDELAILQTFPKVGFVSGVPVKELTEYHTDSTARWWAEQPDGLTVEVGDLIPKSITIDYLTGVGKLHRLERFLARQTDVRLTYQGVVAYQGASHMQFLMPRHVIDQLPPVRITDSVGMLPETLDQPLDELGYLRLSTTEARVYHMGNVIKEPLLQLSHANLKSVSTHHKTNLENRDHWFWGRPRVRRCLQQLNNWAFTMQERYPVVVREKVNPSSISN